MSLLTVVHTSCRDGVRERTEGGQGFVGKVPPKTGGGCIYRGLDEEGGEVLSEKEGLVVELRDSVTG